MAHVTIEILEAFAAAWNRHDVDALMAFMTYDCVFETAAGPEACGSRQVGRDAVRRAFAAAWQNFPDAAWRNGRHFIAGDRGVSEWTFTGTAPDGTRVEADGVDLLTFRGDRIQVKNAFRKDRPRLPALK
jgi:ketosteroid isomerase-like protein